MRNEHKITLHGIGFEGPRLMFLFCALMFSTFISLVKKEWGFEGSETVLAS